MKPAIDLKRKMGTAEPTLGVLIIDHLWLGLIEIAQEAGLDYVIIDTEHIQHDSQLVADACMLGRRTGFPVLLRPTATDFDTIRLAMDLGPCGLLLPMVETAEQLDEVRDGLYMPPRGRRRPGGPGNRWVKTFDYPTFKTQVEDHLIVIPQIESQTGIENETAIPQHGITTALGIGPYDLSANLGVCYQPDHPKLQEAIGSIRRIANDAGKPSWIIGDGETLIEQGVGFFCFAEPSALLQATLKNSVDRLRQADSSALRAYPKLLGSSDH